MTGGSSAAGARAGAEADSLSAGSSPLLLARCRLREICIDAGRGRT